MATVSSSWFGTQSWITWITSFTEERPGLRPIPGTKPLTVEAAMLPPLLYFVGLLFLPSTPPAAESAVVVKLLRNVFGALAAFLFFRLPLAYHVSQSIGLTYQLGLVGLYGGCRIVDAFFINPYLFNHVPRRVQYTHVRRGKAARAGIDVDKEWTDGGLNDGAGNLDEGKTPSAATTPAGVKEAEKKSYFETSKTKSMSASASDFMSSAFTGPEPIPVYETARTEQALPTSFLERASWAIELEMSMRGIGFTWTTADVRHTRETWLPTVANRVHSIMVHVLPVLLGAFVIIRGVCVKYLAGYPDLFAGDTDTGQEVFDAAIPFGVQLALTLAMGSFLMAAFSLGHSLFAIMCAPLAPSPLAFFPPLYTMRVWRVTSVRKFWSYGWHRLFARLFLVYGVWPGEYLERKLTGKDDKSPADIGKVIGAFVSSAFVHSFSVRCVLGGDWYAARGEAIFFALNGVAIVVEELVIRSVAGYRRQRGLNANAWYDGVVGRLWWLAVLILTGRNFARGWVKSALVREMAFI